MQACKPGSVLETEILSLIYYKCYHLSLTTYPLTSDEQPYVR